ncbi:MAG TPA: ferritin-like domain-containing protein [Pseudoneobacillus sp.]|nr:ferritin-like domain-containing protein [Pseudoneobacillus sp.]
MDAKNEVISELNEFLKGQYMGIHSYEHLIQKIQDPVIKNEFQKIQQDHKEHAMMVAERIQNLGGTPVDDEGPIGSMLNFMSQFKIPDDTKGILKTALKGEDYYGIQVSEKIVRGDLDNESYQLIESILDKDRQHVQLLNRLLH